MLGGCIYVACGGTMQGRQFTEDRAVWSWSQAEGWRLVLAELPFPVRHVQMLALRDRLLFYAANDPRGDRIVIHTFAPKPGTAAVPATPHR